MACEVDVVIITWNDGTLFDAALASALRSEGIVPRVIAVDNGSDPPVVVPDEVTLIRNSANRGVAPARNQGIRAGTAPYVCVLDSDARLELDCLARLTDTLRSDPSIGLAAPVFVGQAPEESAGDAFTLRRKLLRALGLSSTYGRAHDLQTDALWPVDFAIGACQVFRRDAFDAVGGLDEGYFYGPEDVDFCLRVKLAGYQVVQVPGASCHHPPRRRNRRILSRRGLQHAFAIGRHSWRHRHFSRQAATE